MKAGEHGVIFVGRARRIAMEGMEDGEEGRGNKGEVVEDPSHVKNNMGTK